MTEAQNFFTNINIAYMLLVIAGIVLAGFVVLTSKGRR